MLGLSIFSVRFIHLPVTFASAVKQADVRRWPAGVGATRSWRGTDGAGGLLRSPGAAGAASAWHHRAA